MAAMTYPAAMAIRFPDGWAERMDAASKRDQRTRQEWLREVVRAALEASERKADKEGRS